MTQVTKGSDMGERPRRPAERAGVLGSSSMENAPQILIGPAGFSYRDWNGIFYPPEVTRKKVHPLEYLARFFDLVEINTSFYGHIKPEIAKLWSRKAAAVNPKFRFTAKLHQSFTHSPLAVVEPTSAATIRHSDKDEALAREGLAAMAAEGRLGALLMQFPVSFKNTEENRAYLDRLLWSFVEYPRVVEVRHASWNHPETLEQFERQQVGFCNIDQPRLGLSLEPTGHVTAPLAYVRLHGRNYQQWFDSESRDDRYNYLYTEKEVGEWKENIARVAGRAKVTYVVTNNHFQAKAGVNALQLKSLLEGRRVSAPETLLAHYPELKKYADGA